MHVDYDYCKDELQWVHEWAKGLSYLIERPQQRQSTVQVPDHELLVCYRYAGDVVVAYTVSKDVRADGIRPPSACIFGSLVDPSTIRRFYPAARWQRRRVGLMTRIRRARALGMRWWEGFLT